MSQRRINSCTLCPRESQGHMCGTLESCRGTFKHTSVDGTFMQTSVPSVRGTFVHMRVARVRGTFVFAVDPRCGIAAQTIPFPRHLDAILGILALDNEKPGLLETREHAQQQAVRPDGHAGVEH